MKIGLINPPQIFSKSQVAAGIVPPLGLAYLASFLIKKGHEVIIVDAPGEGYKTITPWKKNVFLRGLTFNDIIEKVKDCDLVGISNLFTFAFPVVLELSKKIKQKLNKKIVIGGANPSAIPKICLSNDYIDYAILSEGELTLLNLCYYLEGKKDIKNIDGIAYKKGKKIIVNPKTSFIKNLDELPFPARHLLPMQNYFKAHEAHGPANEKWTSLISSRGCPFNCSFCTSSLWNKKWRARSAKNIVDEVEHLKLTYGIKDFHFEDENMTLDKKRTIEICNELIKRKINIKWQTPNGIRASVTDNDTILKMKESGCYHIVVAPESGSNKVLKNIIHKGQDLSHIERIIKYANKIGLKTAAYFVIGLPGETKEDVIKTIDFANKLAKYGLDEPVFSLFIPLPGSELYNIIYKNKTLNLKSYNTLSMGDLSVSKSWSIFISDKELNYFRKKAYISFQITKLIYHPIKFLKMMFNVLLGKEETKTERTLITFIKRLFKR